MTRITNFGRKRAYLPTDPPLAGDDDSAAPAVLPEADGIHPESVPEPGTDGSYGKKKRRRQPETGGEDARPSSGKRLRTDRPAASTTRRLKRISQRQADTICFACRQQGHSARDCPSANENSEGKPTVGICYRCGSTRHSLKRCKKPEDPHSPLPFASCFVCSKKGHLASRCPQNAEKGVYPNGGCCKLCGQTSHLARDCHLRKQDTVASSAIMGVHQIQMQDSSPAHEIGIGADEDDFHSFRRLKSALDKGERKDERKKKQADARVGVLSGKIQLVGKQPVAGGPAGQKAKKVVFF